MLYKLRRMSKHYGVVLESIMKMQKFPKVLSFKI